MGIWGTGPFDNDTAGDMVAKMMVPIDRVLKLPISAPFREVTLSLKKRGSQSRKIVRRRRSRVYSKPVASDHYVAARAAASILLHSHGTDVLGGPSLHRVLEALEKMRADKDWLETWRSSVRIDVDIRKALDRQIRAVRRKIRTCCDRVRTKNVSRPGRVLRRSRKWSRSR
jgi:hypothetical protein